MLYINNIQTIKIYATIKIYKNYTNYKNICNYKLIRILYIIYIKCSI